MKVGVHLPQWGEMANRSAVIDVAQAVEDAGLDSVWVADHIVFPIVSDSTYPYRPDGVPFRAEDGFLEALTQLAVVAGATRRVGLGTSVLVLPMRDPLYVAKIVATLDVLSGGRTVLALGAGWWREEFDALGQRFNARGRRFDEQIAILRGAWEHERFAFDGEFYSFAEVACTPLPVQPGGPPLLIGGMGEAALRRAARHGDGWHAVGGKPEQLLETWQRAPRFDGGGRGAPILSTSAGLHPDPEQAFLRLKALQDMGFGNLVINIDADSVHSLVTRVAALGDQVRVLRG